MITIVRAVQTSWSCPSQWDAWDAEGNYYYLRYRHGYGTMMQYKTKYWLDADYEWDESSDVPFLQQNPEFVRVVASFEHGDELDGTIELANFAELAGFMIGPGIMYTGFGDYLRDELVMQGVAVPELLEEEEEERKDI